MDALKTFLHAVFVERGKMTFYVALICLPTVALLGVGIYFGSTWVPKEARRDAARITNTHRKTAERLFAHPDSGNSSTNDVRTGRRTSKIGGMPWGWYVDGSRTVVWCQSVVTQSVARSRPPAGRRKTKAVDAPRVVTVWLTTSVPTEEKEFHALAYYGVGGLVAAVLVWLTTLAVVYFVRFVRERDDFLAATAHDLTTPLVGLRMMIGRDDDEARNLNERMLLIVNNIKDFLRLGGRRRDPQPARVDLVALCREAYGLFAADYEDAASGPVAFDVSRLRGAALEVFADETMTLQILWNLFGNDLKYAAPYGPVAVRFGRVADRAVLAFVDEGQGMTETQRRRAFDRYYRAKTVLQTGKGGFGIGLCTAREFARAMGGDLVVAANMPRGCVFTLTLPAAGAPSAGRRVPRESDGEANENERKGD